MVRGASLSRARRRAPGARGLALPRRFGDLSARRRRGVLLVAPATTATTAPAVPPVLRLCRVGGRGGSAVRGGPGERLGAWTLRRGQTLRRFGLRSFGEDGLILAPGGRRRRRGGQQAGFAGDRRSARGVRGNAARAAASGVRIVPSPAHVGHSMKLDDALVDLIRWRETSIRPSLLIRVTS